MVESAAKSSYSSPSSTSSSSAFDRLIMLIVRTIYRRRVDIGCLKWAMICMNFLYIASLTDPVTPTHGQVSSQNLSLISSLQWYEFYKLFYVFARPTIILHFYNSSTFDSLLVVSIAVIFAILLLSLVYVIFFCDSTSSSASSSCSRSNNHSSPSNSGNSNNNINSRSINQSTVIMHAILAFSNCFNYSCLMLFTESLAAIAYNGSFDSTTTTAFHTLSFISLILLACVLVFMAFSLGFAEQCITHKEFGLFRGNSNASILFTKSIVKFILAFLAGIDGRCSHSYTFPLLWSLSLLYLLCAFYEFFDAIPFSDFRVQTMYVISCAYALLSVVISILRKSADDESDPTNHIANISYTIPLISRKANLPIQFILTILVIRFSIDAWLKRRNRVFLQLTEQFNQQITASTAASSATSSMTPSQKKKEHKLFSRAINMLIMNQNEILNANPILNMGIYELHQKYCNDLHCFCRGKLSDIKAKDSFISRPSLLKGIEDQSVLLSERFFEQLLRTYIRTDLNSLNVFSNPSNDTQQFLRYMDYFLHSKKHTLALQKVIEIQIESEKLKKPMTRYTRASLHVLLEFLKQTMASDIQRGITELTVETTSKAIEIYIQMHATRDHLYSRLFDCLEHKRVVLERMQKSFEFTQEVEDMNAQFINELESTEMQLTDFFHRFTTPQSQLLLVFFMAEIKGDLKKAHVIKQTRKQSDIAEYLNSKNMFIEVFSNEVVSVTATVGKKLGRIAGYSSKCPEAFGYEKQEFDYLPDIKALLPAMLARSHDEMVRFMMIRGRYNVVHIARNVFLRNKGNFVFSARIFADINFYFAEELPFIFLVQVLQTSSAFLLVNSSGFIEGFCENFFRVLNQTVESLPYSYRIQVHSILPKFAEFTQKLLPFIQQEFYDVDLAFPLVTSPLYQELFTKSKLMRKSGLKESMDSQQFNGSDYQMKFQQQEQDLIRFKANVCFQKRVIPTGKGQLEYFVIELKNVSIQAQQQVSNTTGMLSSFGGANTTLNASQYSLNKQTSVLRFQQRETHSNYTRSCTPQQHPQHDSSCSCEFIDGEPSVKCQRHSDQPKSHRLQAQVIVESDLESSDSSDSVKKGNESNRHYQSASASSFANAAANLNKPSQSSEQKQKSKTKSKQKSKLKSKKHQFRSEHDILDSPVLLTENNKEIIADHDVSAYELHQSNHLSVSGSMSGIVIKNTKSAIIPPIIDLSNSMMQASDIMTEEQFSQLQEIHAQHHPFDSVPESKLPSKDRTSIYSNLVRNSEQQQNQKKKNLHSNTSPDISDSEKNPTQSQRKSLQQHSSTPQQSSTRNHKQNPQQQGNNNNNSSNQSHNSANILAIGNLAGSILSSNGSSTLIPSNNLIQKPSPTSSQKHNQYSENCNEEETTSPKKPKSAQKIISSQSLSKASEKKGKEGNNSPNRGGMQESAYQRYRRRQKMLKENSMRESMPRDLSNSTLSNANDNQHQDLIEKFNASSISGDESERTKQIDKFSFFESFAESKTKPSSLLRLQILKVIEFFTMILSACVIAFTLNASLSDFVQQAQAILLKAEIITPVTSFLTAEFLFRKISDMSSSDYQNRASTLVDLLAIETNSYNSTFTSVSEYYAQTYFKSEFTFEEITVYNPYRNIIDSSQSSNSIPDYSLTSTYANFSLISALSQLNFHINNLVLLESNSNNNGNTIQSTETLQDGIAFIQHNFGSFVDRSSSILSEQLTSSVESKNTLYTNVIIASCAIIAVSVCFYVVINVNFGAFQRLMAQILNIVTAVRTSSVESEILRIRSLIDTLREAGCEEIVETFTFSIRKKEIDMQDSSKADELILQLGGNSQSMNNSSSQSKKRRSLNIQINNSSLSSTRFYAISSLGIFLFVIYITINLGYNIRYFNQFNNGLLYLSTFGEMTYVVPSLLSYSCLIYEAKIDAATGSSTNIALSTSEVATIKESFSTAMNRLEDFSLSVAGVSNIDLFSSSFTERFDSELKSNLCTYVNSSDTKCESIFNGALTSGLVNALAFWKEKFKAISDIQFKVFTAGSNTSSEVSNFYANLVELLRFSSVLNSAQVKYTKEVYSELESVIDTKRNFIIILLIVFSSLVLFPKVYEIIVEAKAIQNRFFIAKKIVFVLPMYTLMMEDTFAKILRAIGKHLELKR